MSETPPRPSLIRGWKLAALQYVAEVQAENQRRTAALAVGLSDDGLNALLKALRQFRDGKPLPPKMRKVLEDVLQEHTRRKIRRTEGLVP
jgi:hypothetical protein